ncbi:MAG: hypothetical protein R3C16_06255 [Hyphomonadaceae bacterium]
MEANENVSPVYGAPAFEDVANTPGMTPLALHVWLNSPHPNMPNRIIPPERIDDIAAYIATLKD